MGDARGEGGPVRRHRPRHLRAPRPAARRIPVIGKPVLRVEDPKFLSGAGRFIEDLSLPGELHCAIVRSPHPHARIRSIVFPAGVTGFSGEDMARDGVKPMRCGWALAGMAEPARYALARGTVRHVGEPVAAVFAETRAAAEHQGREGIHLDTGDAAATDAAFAAAPRKVSIELVNNRLCGAAIETRGALATADTLYVGTQAPHHIRRYVCEELGIDEGALRVVSQDMGGGFGYKGKHYPEETLAVWAARKLRRPVRWIARRNESFLSDTQGRDHRTRAELALDEDGVFKGLKVFTRADLGAYVSSFGAAIPGPIYSALLAGVYRTPQVFVEVTGVFSNTVPTDAYRGAGRPEACYVLERLADKAARELGIDRAEIRRRNLIPAS